MPKIDTSGWGKFRLGKLLNLKNGETKGTGIFNIVNSVAYHGKDIEETNEDAPDTINYVTRSKFNNGVKCKVLKKESYIINPAGTISFGAENADFFYQTEEYITGNKMYYIDTSALSKYSCAFLKSVLEATFTANFSFSDGMTPTRIYDAVIKLPIDSQGNPDWQYMEEYMRNIEVRVSTSISKLESAQGVENSKIDVSSWGEFFISEVFETNKKGKSLQVPTGANVQKKDLEDGSIPRITVTGINNGIYDYYADIPNDNNYRVYENFISVSFLGTVFYQKGKASLDMKVHCLRPIKHTLNEYTGEFLITAILASLKESSYSDQISSTVLPSLTIKLPVDSQGNPDWLYMENYMKALEPRVNNFLNKTA